MICLVLLFVSGLSPAVVAAPDAQGDVVEQIESLARKASAAYKRGAYDEAIELYLNAYSLRKTSALLYNIAVVYDRKLTDRISARRYYRRYLEAEDTEEVLVTRAEVRLKALDREERQIREAEFAQREGANTDQVRGRAPSEVRATSIESERSNGPAWLLWSGGSLLATGGIFWGLAGFEADRFSSTSTLTDKQRLRDSARSKAWIGDGLAAVGASVVMSGLIWYALSGDSDASAEDLTLVPRTNGLDLKGSF